MICLNSSKIPYLCLLIIFFDFVIDSDVIVGRKILRCSLNAFFIPNYSFVIIF